MPIYAYRCESCGHAQDVLQKISDPLLTQCPQCQAPTFQKQVTAAGFQLKGSGWYVTDFRGGGASSAGAAKPAGGDTPSAPAPAAAPASDGGSSSTSGSSTASGGCGTSCACH